MSWKPPRKNSLKTTQREMDSQGTFFCALQGLRGWRRNRNNERGATGETAVLQYSCWPSFGTSTKSPTQVASRKTRTLIKTHSSTKKHVQCVETNKCNGNSHPGFQNTNRFPKSNGAEISSAKGALAQPVDSPEFRKVWSYWSFLIISILTKTEHMETSFWRMVPNLLNTKLPKIFQHVKVARLTEPPYGTSRTVGCCPMSINVQNHRRFH